MISKQYLASCFMEDHPCYTIASAAIPSRTMKDSLVTKFGNEVKNHLPNIPCSKPDYKRAVKQLHRQTVAHCIQNYKNNRVLGRSAPDIHPTERSLPRHVRTKLSQYRSGFCTDLNSYQNRIGNGQDECPRCQQSPHDTQHLFDCQANPTDLKPDSLWNDPAVAAEFLNLT